MSKISKKNAEFYVKRWEAVRQVQMKELRSSSMTQKFRQLCALMDSRSLFGKKAGGDKGVKQVRQYWMELRKVMNDV